jgi:hypothetical protein
MNKKNEYEEDTYQGIIYRKVIKHEKHEGKVKCDCGTYLKCKESLVSHVKTPSHYKRLEYKIHNIPTGNLLNSIRVISSCSTKSGLEKKTC